MPVSVQSVTIHRNKTRPGGRQRIRAVVVVADKLAGGTDSVDLAMEVGAGIKGAALDALLANAAIERLESKERTAAMKSIARGENPFDAPDTRYADRDTLIADALRQTFEIDDPTDPLVYNGAALLDDPDLTDARLVELFPGITAKTISDMRAVAVRIGQARAFLDAHEPIKLP